MSTTGSGVLGSSEIRVYGSANANGIYDDDDMGTNRRTAEVSASSVLSAVGVGGYGASEGADGLRMVARARVDNVAIIGFE